MKRKYYRDLDGKWKNVVILDEEERKLTTEFIKEYAELLGQIEEILGKTRRKYVEIVFNKIASPAHYKFQEVLNARRDEAKYGETQHPKQTK